MLPDPISADGEASISEEEIDPLSPVPDFFQEEGEQALRSQIQWLEEHLGFTDQFFATFLSTTESSFRDWRLDRAALSHERQFHLSGLWRTVLHLLSFMNLDEKRIRTLLDRHIPLEDEDSGPRRYYLTPPWIGSSLRSYLEERGLEALVNVDRWVSMFRFGNPYPG